MKRVWVLLIVSALVAGTALGQAAPGSDNATSKAMTDLAGKTRGSLGIIKFTVENKVFGSMSVVGMGICIEASEKGAILVTTALNPGVPYKNVKKVEVLVPGQDKTLSGEVPVATDPETGLTFVTVKDAFKWQPVKFAEKADLPVGKQVFSVGLLDQWLEFEPYLGSAFVSARVRVPGPMVYVSGGSLTNIGSPVFTADGQAVGIVLQQLPNTVTLAGGGQQSNVLMSSQRETSCFVPVDDFASALKDHPAPGKRASYIGVLQWVPHPEEVVRLGVPAVRAAKVAVDSPAAKAGLQDNDTVTAINGQTIEKLATPELTVQNFVRKLNRIKVGETVELTVLRPSAPAVLKIKAESFPMTPTEVNSEVVHALGLAVRDKVGLDQTLDPSPAGKPDAKGVYVIGVFQGGPAAIAGLKGEPEYNLIVNVAGQPVSSAEEFKKVAEGALAADPKKAIAIVVQKGAVRETLNLQPATPK